LLSLFREGRRTKSFFQVLRVCRLVWLFFVSNICRRMMMFEQFSKDGVFSATLPALIGLKFHVFRVVVGRTSLQMKAFSLPFNICRACASFRFSLGILRQRVFVHKEGAFPAGWSSLWFDFLGPTSLPMKPFSLPIDVYYACLFALIRVTL